MKTHRTCGECRNSKPYDEGEYPLLCKKTGIAICEDDCCSDFVPKEIKTYRTCGECRNSDFHRDSRWPRWCVKQCTEVNPKDCCSDFVPKNCVAKTLEAVARKAATTGNRSDLQAYLKLRREML